MKFKITKRIEAEYTVEIDIPLPEYIEQYGKMPVQTQAAAAYIEHVDNKAPLQDVPDWQSGVVEEYVTYSAQIVPDFTVNENVFLSGGPGGYGFSAVPAATMKPKEGE
jgi:hypothetical protein